MSKSAKFTIGLLFVLVIISLALNAFLIWQWMSFQQRVQQAVSLTQLSLTQAVTDLNDLKATQIELTVPVQQNIPIRTDIPFNETFTVPINTEVPFNHEIKTQVFIEMPELGLRAPLDVTVPINTQVPINIQTEVPINSVIPVQTTVPLQLEVPISISISDTPLAEYIDQLRFLLASMNGTLSSLSE